MRSFLERCLSYMMRGLFWFRYRIKVKGLEKLNPKTLKKPGGMLFLPNHPAVLIDPVSAVQAVLRKFSIRPMVVEQYYYFPLFHWALKFFRALPMPDFEKGSSGLKRKRSEKVLEDVISGLKDGDNFLVYPAGATKGQGEERIGGASGAHRIVSNAKEANVVLVRIKGLWGSSFSRALTGKPVNVKDALWHGLKVLLKN